MKYRKLLLECLILRVEKQTTAAEMAKEVGTLKTIRLIQEAWVSASEDTIRNCGFTDDTCAELDTNVEEYASFVKESTFEVSPEDFVAVVNTVPCQRTPFDTSTCEWPIRLREETLQSLIASAKKIYVESDTSDDEAEYEEKTVSVPSVRAAIQMVDE